MALFKKKDKTELKDRRPENDLGVIDLPYLLLTLLLLGIGLVMLFSSSYASSYHGTSHDAIKIFRQQLIFAGIGIVTIFFVSNVNYEIFRRFSMIIFMAAVGLLALVLIPGIGKKINGARRWINIGVLFQPSEIGKFAAINILSVLLVRFQKTIKKFKTMLLCAAPIAIIVILILLEPHLSCALIIIVVAYVLLLVGGAHKGWLILPAIGLLVLAAFLVWKVPYVQVRLAGWLNTEETALNEGMQPLQSLYAIGSGGLTGLGFGMSRQKYLYLPEAYNDYIFSIVCEELGLIGAFVILFLFAMLIIRGYWIAMHAKDRYSMLFATGLTTMLAIQVILNIAVDTNLLPSTGISLPFFSSGGTALLMQMGEAGVMLNISRNISQTQAEKKRKNAKNRQNEVEELRA